MLCQGMPSSCSLSDCSWKQAEHPGFKAKAFGAYLEAAIMGASSQPILQCPFCAFKCNGVLVTLPKFAGMLAPAGQ